MKNLKIWLLIIAIFAIVGVGLGTFLKVGVFGYVIGAFCALLVGLLVFKKKSEKENADKKVYDEDRNYYK